MKAIADRDANLHIESMEQTAKDALLKMVVRLPDWIRHDLTAKDTALRLRAEESLAAMLADAVDRASAGK